MVLLISNNKESLLKSILLSGIEGNENLFKFEFGFEFDENELIEPGDGIKNGVVVLENDEFLKLVLLLLAVLVLLLVLLNDQKDDEEGVEGVISKSIIVGKLLFNLNDKILLLSLSLSLPGVSGIL